MRFAGVNYLAIVIAAVVAWLAGAAWYTAFSKSWMAAFAGMSRVAESRSRESKSYDS